MNSLAHIIARPQRIVATTYEAFRIDEPVKGQWDKDAPLQSTRALGPVNAGCLEEARSAALAKWNFYHKGQLIIRETRARGTFLHIYAIVRKPDTWVWKDHVQVRQQRLDTKFLCVIDSGVLAQHFIGEPAASPDDARGEAGFVNDLPTVSQGPSHVQQTGSASPTQERA